MHCLYLEWVNEKVVETLTKNVTLRLIYLMNSTLVFSNRKRIYVMFVRNIRYPSLTRKKTNNSNMMNTYSINKLLEALKMLIKRELPLNQDFVWRLLI